MGQKKEKKSAHFIVSTLGSKSLSFAYLEGIFLNAESSKEGTRLFQEVAF